jgi:hypothetical protein
MILDPFHWLLLKVFLIVLAFLLEFFWLTLNLFLLPFLSISISSDQYQTFLFQILQYALLLKLLFLLTFLVLFFFPNRLSPLILFRNPETNFAIFLHFMLFFKWYKKSQTSENFFIIFHC